MIPSLFDVTERKQETADTVTVKLRAREGHELLPFRAGQFNMLYAFGLGEIPVSLSGDPARQDELVHTTRAVGAVSRAICELEPGASIGVRGPFGTAWPLERAQGRDLLIIAGGIGLAPLRPAIYQALAPNSPVNRVEILVGSRTPIDLLFLEEMEVWQRQGAGVHITVDAGDEEWMGNVGVVTDLTDRIALEPFRTLALICGPEIMMRFAVRSLIYRGIPETNIYLTMERNMKCAIGFCGHCQFGADFVCKDGPVFPFSSIRERFFAAEI